MTLVAMSSVASTQAPSFLRSHTDPVYHATLALREPGRLLTLIRAAWPQGKILQAALKQTSYNPYSRTRLVAELLLDEPDAEPHTLSIKVFETSERAAEVYSQELTKRFLPTPGPALMLLGDANIVAWWLPNGQNLRRSRVCFDHQRFVRFLAKRGLCTIDAGPAHPPQLLRYVPRRRVLFRSTLADGRQLYLKFYEGRNYKRAAKNLRSLSENSDKLGFATPPLLAYNKKRGCVVMGAVPGVMLTELIPAVGPETLSAVGQALARLHASSLRVKVEHTAVIELQALIAAMVEVKSVLPPAAIARLDGLLSSLTHACPMTRYFSPVHGNLFGDQILVANGSDIGLVDWDDLSCGDPLYDLGRLAAHLIYLSLCGQVDVARVRQYLGALFGGYGKACLEPIDYQRLRWQVAVALLMRAKISALRPLPEGWAMHIEAAITAAQEVLDGRWLPS